LLDARPKQARIAAQVDAVAVIMNYRSRITAMVDPTPLHRASLHEEVAARLRTMMFERELEAGAWVDELALARDWNILR
jgi:hypothetical protein